MSLSKFTIVCVVNGFIFDPIISAVVVVVVVVFLFFFVFFLSFVQREFFKIVPGESARST